MTSIPLKPERGSGSISSAIKPDGKKILPKARADALAEMANLSPSPIPTLHLGPSFTLETEGFTQLAPNLYVVVQTG